MQWRIQYIHQYQNDQSIHTIVFSKHDNLTEEEHIEFSNERIKSYSFDQLLQLIKYICVNSVKFFDHSCKTTKFNIFWVSFMAEGES